MAKAELQAAIASLGLSITTAFVPWSQSRNKGEKHPSLNWSVTLQRNGRDVLTTEYMAGSAHCPSYQQCQTQRVAERVMYECEHGYPAAGGDGFQPFRRPGSDPLRPDVCDVVCSLAMDSDAIDHATFEDYASNMGMNPDSRKDEAIYRACLEIGLKLRAALGDAGLQQVRDACQDY